MCSSEIATSSKCSHKRHDFTKILCAVKNNQYFPKKMCQTNYIFMKSVSKVKKVIVLDLLCMPHLLFIFCFES